MTPWLIPFENTNHLCWRDEKNTPMSRPLSKEEERIYFSSDNKEQYLASLCK